MSIRIIKTCPFCKGKTRVPWIAVISAPFWPFGSWSCGYCHNDLRYKLSLYYLVALPGLVITEVVTEAVSSLFELFGYTNGHPVNVVAMLFSGLILVLWLPARIGVVELGRA